MFEVCSLHAFGIMSLPGCGSGELQNSLTMSSNEVPEDEVGIGETPSTSPRPAPKKLQRALTEDSIAVAALNPQAVRNRQEERRAAARKREKEMHASVSKSKSCAAMPPTNREMAKELAKAIAEHKEAIESGRKTLTKEGGVELFEATLRKIKEEEAANQKAKAKRKLFRFSLRRTTKLPSARVDVLPGVEEAQARDELKELALERKKSKKKSKADKGKQ